MRHIPITCAVILFIGFVGMCNSCSTSEHASSEFSFRSIEPGMEGEKLVQQANALTKSYFDTDSKYFNLPIADITTAAEIEFGFINDQLGLVTYRFHCQNIREKEHLALLLTQELTETFGPLESKHQLGARLYFKNTNAGFVQLTDELLGLMLTYWAVPIESIDTYKSLPEDLY